MITLDGGTIAEQGTYAELITRDGAFSRLMAEFGNVEEEEEEKVEGEADAIEAASDKNAAKDKVFDRALLTKKGDKLIQAEERYTGQVRRRRPPHSPSSVLP